MKKVISILCVLIICLSLCACAGSGTDDKLKEILCSGEWVSEDNIIELGDGYAQAYPTIRFFEDGTLEYELVSYKDGQITSSGTNTKTWKIKKGKVAVIPEIVDSDTDIEYYEYNDGVLIGSAWYCDRFTYTQKTPANTVPSSNEETIETTPPPAICYPSTQFPTIESVITKMNCEPTKTQEDLCVRYTYTEKFVLVNDMDNDFRKFAESYEADVLSQFEKVCYTRPDPHNSMLNLGFDAWLDGTGHALMIEHLHAYTGGDYYLCICILAEDDVEAYIDARF